ncbi:hypothetical protein DH2020_014729 [Rehmannia glutinosa]|uniref:Cell wall hydroxyproline-rich glycoprotein n=1 Tax=Rehmannia glutinosa TaxID=99300 RepID=A0ABR0WY73_REHGL
MTLNSTTRARPTPPPTRWRRPSIVFLILTLLTYQISITSAQESNINLDDIQTDANKFNFENPNLRQAYIALQAWKQAIFSDPFNFTANWTGPDVCSYGGVFCAASTSNSSIRVVAGIDLNHADIAGYLPDELGLLTDLALLHINSNRFCGVVPESFKRLKLLFELDLSNNRFVGGFPKVVISLPSLKFLDLRFNDFEGGVPTKIFDKKLDALFLNDNRFRFGIPENLGNSPVSVLVMANNNLGGCIPGSIGKMGKTLNELILMNDNLTGCLPPQIGMLKKLTVFDVRPLAAEISRMRSLEQLNVAHNRFTGEVPGGVCGLPRLQNFTYSYNYFTTEAAQCRRFGGGKVYDGKENCIPNKRDQRSAKECSSDDAKAFDCRKSKCGGGGFSPVPSRSRTKPIRKPRPSVKPSSPPPPPKSKSSPGGRSRPPPPPLLLPPPPPTNKVSPGTREPEFFRNVAA